MRTNYMMTVDDVMEELGVKRSKAYSILKQLNDELAKEGYVAVRGKIPRPYWETKFYGCSQRAVRRRIYDVSLQRQNTGNLVCELPLY